MGAAGVEHREAGPQVPESQGLGLPGAEAAGCYREEPGTGSQVYRAAMVWIRVLEGSIRWHQPRRPIGS